MSWRRPLAEANHCPAVGLTTVTSARGPLQGQSCTTRLRASSMADGGTCRDVYETPSRRCLRLRRDVSKTPARGQHRLGGRNRKPHGPAGCRHQTPPGASDGGSASEPACLRGPGQHLLLPSGALGALTLGDGRPRGGATLQACMTVPRRVRQCLPHEYSLPRGSTTDWEQALSRHRTCPA